MKKITSIFILVSSISICFNQDIKEEILSRYKNGTKKEVLKVFDNANFKVKLERIIYSNHGYPIFVESFFDDRIVERDYFNNGKLKKEINYKNKMLNGEILEYFDNDQLKCSFIYDKGEIKPGKYNSYYINGFIKDTFSFGDIIEYHDNGKLKFKAFAIDTITYDHSIKYSEFLKSFIDTFPVYKSSSFGKESISSLYFSSFPISFFFLFNPRLGIHIIIFVTLYFLFFI